MNEHFVHRDCPICGSVGTEIYRCSYELLTPYLENFYGPQGPGVEYSYLENQDYILAKCCGVYQVEIPNDALLERLYSQWIDRKKVSPVFEENASIGYFTGLGDELKQVALHFNKKPSELKLLDFGMGWGRWVQIAQAYGFRAEGAEIDSACIEHAEEVGIPVASELGSYHFINTEQVFEHLPNPKEIIQQLASALEPNGILKISVPDGSGFTGIQDEQWRIPKGAAGNLNVVAPLEHVNCFNEASLVKLAESAGLKPIQLIDRAPDKLYRRFKGMVRKPYSESICLFFTPK